MRGTQHATSFLRVAAGIIPAYAGNTTSKVKDKHLWRDHPRVCGEHSSSPWMLSEATGSSPRMRGTRYDAEKQKLTQRIIPAYAGNTPYEPPCDCGAWDHPRVCGEHADANKIYPGQVGSSPRMRGTPPHAHKQVFQRGIIPAYAGNTIIDSPMSVSPWDHPRVCGEH